MSDSWNTDIADFPDPAEAAAAELPAPARSIRDHLGGIVQAATAWLPGVVLESAIRCRRRPGRRPCPGHIRLVLPDDLAEDATIEWSCTVCGDHGTIRGWQGSSWDLSMVDRDPRWSEGEGVELMVTAPQYSQLRALSADDATLLAIVMVASTDPAGIRLEMTIGEARVFLSRLATAVLQVRSRRRRDLLLELLARMNAAAGSLRPA